MARTRDVVLTMKLCESKRSDNSCAHDRKNHAVPRGDTWLKITAAGAMGSTKGYCVPCAKEILIAAKTKIDALLAEVDATEGEVAADDAEAR